MTSSAQNASLNRVQFSCGYGLSAVPTMLDATPSLESESVAAWKMAERWFSEQSLALLASSITQTWSEPGELATAPLCLSTHG